MEKLHVCPWWLGYFLINPLRKYSQNPEKLTGSYIKPGMSVIDFGSAMGYFSLPMAKMVGNTGYVYCFDIQDKMLSKLAKRAKKAGLDQVIKPCLISNNEQVFIDLKHSADFALLFAVAHEVPDKEKLFQVLFNLLKDNSLLLFAEPMGHVSAVDFKQSVSFAEKAGFLEFQSIKINRSHAILLKKV